MRLAGTPQQRAVLRSLSGRTTGGRVAVQGDWRVADSLASRCTTHGGRASQLVCGAESDPFFDEYREMELIHLYMEALALEHPTITEFIPSIGASFEGCGSGSGV
eukprot:SAG25_NODE_427_length_8159_cov_9.134491_7_plen_105_part_00